MREATQRQRQVLEAIERITEQQGFPPSLRQLGTECGIRSTNAVKDHLNALRKRGLVTWQPKLSRSLRVVHPDKPPQQPLLPALRTAHLIDIRLVRTRDERWSVVIDGQRTPVQGARTWREALMVLTALPDAPAASVTIAGNVGTVHDERGQSDGALNARLGQILTNLRDGLDPCPNPLPFEPPDT